MKSIRIFLSFTLVTGFLFYSVSGQDTNLNEDAVKTLLDSAQAKLKNIAYRETFQFERFAVQGVTSLEVYKHTKLFSPPESEQLIIDRTLGSRILHSETIKIGNRRYIKTNDVWLLERSKETDPLRPSDVGMGSGRGTGAGVDKPDEVTVNRAPLQMVNGVTCDLYEVLRRTFFTTSISGVKITIETIYSNRYWFDQHGRIIRIETETKAGGGKKLRISLKTYEYDSNIKIKAPIN